MSEPEALAHMKRIYSQIVPVAEAYGITVNIEPHGHFTTKPAYMEEMLAFVDSPFLRMNMDTGNTFIAGEDPVAFLEKFVDKVSHVHIKDVSEALARAMRGEETGIASSEIAVGEGVNAENIMLCLDIMAGTGREIPISPEAGGDRLMPRSIAWVRDYLNRKGYPLV